MATIAAISRLTIIRSCGQQFAQFFLDCCVNATRRDDLQSGLRVALVFPPRDVQDDGKRRKSDRARGVNVVMDGFIGRLVANIGVMRDVAEKAVDIISDFVRREKPADTAESLTSRLQAAVALAATGGRACLFDGADAILGVETRLIGTDLGVEHAQRRAREGVGLSRKRSGKDIVCRIVGAVLGRQFL